MNGRADSLDIMKGWLRILMILSYLTYVVPFSGIESFITYCNRVKMYAGKRW